MLLKVQNSPFTEEQTELLNRLLPTLTEQQKIWLCGYLSYSNLEQPIGQIPGNIGIANDSAATTIQPVQQSVQTPVKIRTVTVLYGTETGNAQQLSEQLVQKLKTKDFEVELFSLDEFKPKNLKKVEDLFIITATHGEGEPPENARDFYEFLFSKRAPKLKDIRFSVLALGDQSYEFFCQTGKDFDKRLEELGGERLLPRVDCDVDYENEAEEWIENVVEKLIESREIDHQGAASATSQAVAPFAVETAKETTYSKKNPFYVEVLENINLNGRGSNKETRHIVLSIEDSGIAFEPGDIVGILPENDPVLVDQIIELMGWNSEETVTISKEGDQISLRHALLSKFEISRLTKPLIQSASEIFDNTELKEFIRSSTDDELREYLDGRDLFDLLSEYPPKSLEPNELINILRKLPVREYSIASSLKANPDEVHLTIGKDIFTVNGRERTGVCSGQISERLQVGDTLPIYVHRNPNFKLPLDTDAPLIMIGPGTGVAPFRAFLQEREELEAKGKTWLFFGDQHFSSDFLYQIEWQDWLKKGVLTKLDVAFSRDTEQKIYVQHRMLENSKEFYQWLTEGAYIYVCGDEKRMAKDVHETILHIVQTEGSLTEEQAKEYVDQLRKEKRYQRDVY
jgi:sulfite reductase (NADPH) flavoprotein alpha-component